MDLMPTLTEALEVWIAQGVVTVMNRFTGEPLANP
jgi:hypothetical protein